jgi:dienelactone hydrolase
MRPLALLLILFLPSAAQPLPGTKPLELQGDLAATMVEGIAKYLQRATDTSGAHRRPTRERLAKILGVVDSRVAFDAPRLLATTAVPALLAETEQYRVYAVAWPVLDGVTAEGLLFQPAGQVRARVVAIPDADGLPEQFTIAQRLAAAGCQVLSPVLIDRKDTWSGIERFRMTNQPHREFIYRMAFGLGRHIWGYEVQKVLAAFDWFSSQPQRVPIGVWGYGEGGGVALFSAALDERIDAAGISGYFGPREGVWQEPLYRNVFGLLKDFGDAEIAALIAPRSLIIDTSPGPRVDGPPPETGKRRGAAPGRLSPASRDAVRAEFERARALSKGEKISLDENGADIFATAIGVKLAPAAPVRIPEINIAERQHRQLREIVDHTQELIPASETVRNTLWSKVDRATHEIWKQHAPELRAKLWDEVIGRLPASDVPLNVRTREAYQGATWDGYDVVYDVAPDVIGYGVLLLPKNIPAGEKRPVIVAQHGLEGRPQFLFGLEEVEHKDGRGTNFHYYQNIGSKLADRGYVVYIPQNPYIGDFRKINRLANPLGLSLFSFILAQHDRMLDWLSSLAYVDASRIGFYGLSYGGKTAVRVPPLLDRYALSICSGDFNEWIYKISSVDAPYTYPFTPEWEIPEFDLASVANHAEMAKMMAPRPFMVERGHRDGVGVDEWVGYEYAKVKRFYDEMGIGDRTEIEYFNGPHKIHGVGTLEFIRKHLGR